MQDKLSGAEQENILTLMCFDKEALPLLVNSIDIELFESFIFREIATQALNYFKEFKKPISNHLPDTLTHILEGSDRGKAELFKETLEDLYHNKDSINRKYVLSKLENFIDAQSLKLRVLKSAELLQSGKLDEAKLVLEEGRKQQLSVFDPGTHFADTKRVLRFFDTQLDFIPTGIEHLDRFGIAPAPGELFTFAGLSGVGKTWFFIHIAKIAMLLRKKVLHISLEMSEENLSMRYVQNLFGFAKRNEKVDVPVFETDELGRFADISFTTVKPKGYFANPKARSILEKKLNALKTPNLLIKDFPTGDLTINGLKAYLENLISFSKFHPDLILIDEPDLMCLDANEMRMGIRQIYIGLRGMAKIYNTAIVVVSQCSKGAKTVKWIDERYLSEDFNKMRISDNLVTYNQTDMEYENNLARLFVVKGRNDRKGTKILMSQNYSMGQFCLDSVKMSTGYWKIPELKEDTGKEEEA